MEQPLAKSAKHADFVYKQLVKADELYDAESLDECVKILFDLIENYDMAPFARIKTLGTLCELFGDWEYAEACRLEAEYLYDACSKHPEDYDPDVLAKFRAPLDELATTWAEKPVSEMSDEEIKYRLSQIGGVKVKSLPIVGPRTSEAVEQMLRDARRQALERYRAETRKE